MTPLAIVAVVVAFGLGLLVRPRAKSDAQQVREFATWYEKFKS